MSLESVQVSQESSQPKAERPRRTRRLGAISLALAVVAVGLEVLAIAVGSSGSWIAATILAWVVMGFFALALALGAVAMLTRNGWRFGIAAAVLGLVANPLTLVGVFRVLGASG